jgi:hypothetical protein
LRIAGSEFLSLIGRQAEVLAFLVVDHFPSPSAASVRVFLLLFPGAAHADL